MWVCEKCKEKNEDSFDSCWSCQNFSKTGSASSKIQQQKIIQEDKRESERESEREKIKGSKGLASWLNRKPLIPILLGLFFISWWGFKYYNNQLKKENSKFFEEYKQQILPSIKTNEEVVREIIDAIELEKTTEEVIREVVREKIVSEEIQKINEQAKNPDFIKEYKKIK
tara:strand:- start:2763 stop:3272 length:510 start_codon:yes stop_codon:yes gene_type:complete